MNEIESPCIRNCCLDDNDICMGCFRTLDEITSWQSSTVREKNSVFKRCDSRKHSRKSKPGSINQD